MAVLGAHEAGGQHVACINGRFAAHRIGDGGEVRHRVWHHKILGEVAVIDCGVFVSAERTPALAGVAGLTVAALETRSDRVDRHALTLHETCHIRPGCVHNSEGFVAEGDARVHW